MNGTGLGFLKMRSNSYDPSNFGGVLTSLCMPDLDVVTSEREARSEFLLIYTKNLSMSGRPAGPPARRPWSRFWEAYISGTVSPIDKQSSLVGNPIPSAVHGTNAESCQCLLWHVARAT